MLWTLPVLCVLMAKEDPSEWWVEYPEGAGPGAGHHIVLLAGDEEYRSEEALPQLGKILSQHHGFRCTVLFSIDPESGFIDPENQTHIPGLEALSKADMMVLFWRFRELPDPAMKQFVDYVESGRPILGLRTATHAFAYSRNPESPYASYRFNSETWPGGFGQQVLGDTWIRHHGHHGSQSTRGLVDPSAVDHPILRGVEDVWGPTDVYGIDHLLEEDQILLRGQVLDGMDADSTPAEGAQNDPMMPILWTRERQVGEQTQRIVCSTMGASVDLNSEGLRRALVNSCYWGLGLEGKIPAKSKVDIVEPWKPSNFGFGGFLREVRPADHALDKKPVQASEEE